MIKRCWHCHSKTIVGLLAGSAICLGALPLDNDRHWDIAVVIGGALVAIGLNGLWDIHFREIAKPED